MIYDCIRWAFENPGTSVSVVYWVIFVVYYVDTRQYVRYLEKSRDYECEKNSKLIKYSCALDEEVSTLMEIITGDPKADASVEDARAIFELRKKEAYRRAISHCAHDLSRTLLWMVRNPESNVDQCIGALKDLIARWNDFLLREDEK